MNSFSQNSQRRLEIEGLRAVAASLVAVYHIWLGGVSGGVDAFFAVSGFLITSSLLSQQEKQGRINPFYFWAKLARRIFPVALLVIFTTAIFGTFILPQVLWVDTIKHAAASLVYAENWRLAFDAVNYLTQGMEATPYQQFWALSVQGQFYLLWPIVFLFILSFKGIKSKRLFLGGAFLLIFSASLIYSVISTAHNQAFAYYDTFARLWEFSIGAALALCINKIKINKILSFSLGWLGLLGLVFCGLVLDVSNQFPGYVALVPTLGVALVIISGNSITQGSAAQLLSNRYLVRLGGYSYAFYLWHWPVLVFFRHLTKKVDISFIEGAMIIAISFILSIVSTRLFESPIRNSLSLKNSAPLKSFLVIAFMAFPAGATIAGWAAYTKGELLKKIELLDISDPRFLGARVLYEAPTEPQGLDVYPTPVNASRDRPKPYMDQCQQKSTEAELLSCVYGKPDGNKVIAIVGGSHSVQWLPAFEAFAEEDGYKLVNYTKNFCLFSSPVGFGKVYSYPSCTEWNAQLMQELIASKPDLVFTTYTRDGGINEYVPEGYLAWFKKLEEHGIQILAMRDNPWLPFEPSKCVEIYGVKSAKCRVDRDKVLARTDPIKNIEINLTNTKFVDFSHFFCDEEECFPELGNVLIYRDSNHITGSYMRTISPYLRKEVQLAMNRP
ncbi:acyltransferase family protein [Modicisalibacter luteus]|uniref:Acyltransferase family protein n=2 Tax=Modicisalibacter luteus TaxID=453962 RepID=A0ABV7LZF6_9GAMM|nr:acyltransferase family protein [Halomonas lutea]